MTKRLTIHLLDAAERERAERIWKRVESACRPAALAVSWNWTEAWLRHYGDVVPHRFAVGYSQIGGEAQPRGIVLLSERIKRRGPIAMRRLYVGTAGEPDGETVYVQRNGVLAEPAWRQEFVRALLATLGRDVGWHELELPGFSADEAALFLNVEPKLAVTSAPTPTRELRGDDDLQGIIASMPRRTRERMRRQLRFWDDLQGDWPETPAEKLAVFEELGAIQRESRRAGEAPAAMASRRFLSFHRDLIGIAPDRALPFRLRNGDETLACLYALEDRGELVGYQAAVKTPPDKRQSPGLVAHLFFMAAAAQRGYAAYDMSPGGLEYKRRLTDGEGELVWARTTRGRARVLDPHWQHAVAV
jgi:hypothetical protein